MSKLSVQLSYLFYVCTQFASFYGDFSFLKCRFKTRAIYQAVKTNAVDLTISLECVQFIDYIHAGWLLDSVMNCSVVAGGGDGDGGDCGVIVVFNVISLVHPMSSQCYIVPVILT